MRQQFRMAALAAVAIFAVAAMLGAPVRGDPLPEQKPITNPEIPGHWLSAGAAGIFPDPTPSATPSPTVLREKRTPGEIAFEKTRDGSWMEPESWSVTAYKSRHQLVVYYKGRLYKVYHAVFGRSLEHGAKLFEGDRRTPEGVYTIIGKHRSRRFDWFLTLNYPNDVDRIRYEELENDGDVPSRDGHAIGEGGRIGIHGTDNPILNAGNINWTTGCISVGNGDVRDLNRLLPVGTVVIIKP
jgi:L,D-transpeptidase catalytic domain